MERLYRLNLATFQPTPLPRSMTEKLVTLKLEGDLVATGFHVLLEIGEEGARPDMEAIGSLPASPPLLQQLQKWQDSYRLLDIPSRIQPVEITYVGSLHTVDACQQEAKKLGQQFKTWLQSSSFAAIDRPLREELNPDDMVRLVIRTTSADLQHLPWHLWDLADRYPGVEIALGAPTIKRSETPIIHHSAVKILAILGDSSGIDVAADRQLLAAIPGADVTFLVEPQRQQITDQLWEQPWDLLFFAGHGRTEAGAGTIYINPDESLTLDELKYGLRQAIKQGLQLAIFNACDGLGLAAALAPLGLPQMILMREPVPDRVAQTFLKHFLDAFVAGESLYLATRQARERLQGLEDRFPCASWLPIIFQVNPAVPKRWQQLAPQQTTRPPGPQVGGLSVKTLFIMGAMVTATVGLLRWTGILQRSELLAYDRLMRQQPAQTVDKSRLLIVEITESDVNTYGYPIPDDVLAEGIDQLLAHQPRVIGLDIARNRVTPDSGPLGQQFQQQDSLVAVCSFGQTGDANKSGIGPPAEMPENRVGFGNVVPDPDGILRRQLLFAQPDTTSPCTSRMSLAMLTALHYLDAEGIEPENLDRDRLKLGAAIFTPLEDRSGGYQNIDSRGFQTLLKYSSKTDIAERISLNKLLSEEIPLENLATRAVFIGMSAPTSNPTEYFLTPVGAGQWPQETLSGIDIHAQIFSYVVAAALDDQSVLQTWPGWGDGLWIALWTLVGAGLTLKRRGWTVWLLSLGGAVFVLYSASWGLFALGLWVPLVPAALGLVGASGGAIASTLYQTTPEKYLIHRS
ncbi:MAG: CHASE2 domain-containing protein [Cyanobacteria bacterium P01_H01_bin.21]